MAYPDSFINWWQKQTIHKAYTSHFISVSMYDALTRIAYSGWQAHARIQESEEIDSKNASLFKQVSQIIREKISFGEEQITQDKITLKTSFIKDLGADSLDLVELTMAFEDHFNIEFPDEEVEKVKTVKDAIDLIQKKL
jgi:acyl carrier protein